MFGRRKVAPQQSSGFKFQSLLALNSGFIAESLSPVQERDQQPDGRSVVGLRTQLSHVYC